MIGEILVMGLIVVVIVLAVYLVTRKPAPEFVLKDPVWKAPMNPAFDIAPLVAKPVYVAPPAPVFKAGKASQARTSTVSSSSRSYPSGGSTHVDTTPDTLTTLLILDAMTPEPYYAPPVDTYTEPSYSSPTPSSYSSSDDSCSRSSYSDTSSYSSYSSSDSSSSYSDSSSSSSSSSSCD